MSRIFKQTDCTGRGGTIFATAFDVFGTKLMIRLPQTQRSDQSQPTYSCAITLSAQIGIPQRPPQPIIAEIGYASTPIDPTHVKHPKDQGS